MKNRYTKVETKKKKEYEKRVLSNIKQKWKYIREDEGEKTPVKIKLDGKETTCQREIATKYSDHILKKIDELTKNLPDKTAEAMEVFKKLVNKVEEDFSFKTVSYREVYKIVSRLKPSKSRGENELTNSFIREIPQFSSTAIMHLFNSIIRSGRFPENFKVSRILPLRKRDKVESSLDSFRPVNNLNSLEKVVELLLKN